jgi:arylsulfatase A-like enzyme
MKYISVDEYNTPLLFFLHTYQIHSLFYPEKEVVNKFYKKGDLKYESFDIMEFTKYGKEQFIKGVPEKEKNEIIKMYDAGIRTFDYRFGKFIKFLKKKKLYDRSLIILFADHGEEFGDHGGWAHGHSLYNELIKIPLIVKFPGNKQAGLEVYNVVSIVDIIPTVLALHRIKNESGESQGIPLTEAIKNKTGNRNVFSYLAAHARYKTAKKTAVISNRFKLIYNQKMSPADLDFFLSPPPPTSQYELFDLEEDPFELINRIKENKFEFYQLLKILGNLKYKKPGRGSKNELERELKSLGYIH